MRNIARDRRIVAIVGALIWIVSAVAHADLILTSPPRETPERGQQIYGPLAELLSSQLAVRVVYEHSGDWLRYSTRMRADKYDIIFDGPHFAAWRMKHLQHAPVARLPGRLSFVVVGRRDDKHTRLRDIVSTRMCGMASPNLGTLSVLAAFNNPIVQPDLYEVADMTDVYAKFLDGKCGTAVFQDKFLTKLPASERGKLRVIHTSNAYPDQTVTVSRRVTDRQRAVLAEVLTRPSGVDAAHELLKQYAKQAKTFEAAKVQDYAGLEDLLEGVVWGW